MIVRYKGCITQITIAKIAITIQNFDFILWRTHEWLN